MNTALATLLSLALFCASTSLAQRRDLIIEKSKRFALVIGNAAYKQSPLSNPVNDASDIARTLSELGFEVIYKQNASQAEMKRAIREFGDKIVKGDVALFYFAGHGAQVNGENYLIPVDAVITKEEEIEYESVNAGFVMSQMASARNKLNIVILDACRNNPFARSFRSQAQGLAQISAPAGTLIAYATAPGSVAADGKGTNGLYTEELLKSMRAPGLKIEDVFKQVRVAVRKKSQGKQTPWESSSLEGDFYFVQTGDNKTQTAAGVDTADVSLDLIFWESIENSNDPRDFEAYLKKYPNGDFVDLANNRIKSLGDSNGASAPVNAAPETPIDNSSNKDEQPQTLKFKLGHQHGGAFSSSYHEGFLSISPQKIQWEEIGLMSDRDDNFSVSCSDITGVHVNLREGEPKPETTIADHEYIRLELKNSALNRKGRKRYSFPVIDISDKETIKAAGEAIKHACPDLKLKAYKFSY